MLLTSGFSESSAGEELSLQGTRVPASPLDLAGAGTLEVQDVKGQGTALQKCCEIAVQHPVASWGGLRCVRVAVLQLSALPEFLMPEVLA